MPTYSAKILEISEIVEGEILLLIEDFKLLCFCFPGLPYGINAGDLCQVELTPTIFFEYVVEEVNDEEMPSILRLGNDFSHMVVGRLVGNIVRVGQIEFEDDLLQYEFGYLDGKMISWKVDRIDVDFLLKY